MIYGSINSSSNLLAATKEEEIKEEIILNRLSLATQWLIKQQRSDGSWPIVTQDKHSSVVATGLFGLGTFSRIVKNKGDKSTSPPSN